jgi:bifunctional enzyme CysN/CysC
MAAPAPAIKDIEAHLKARERQSLLRFITCGSVDDGKSTLIGRLLYDSGNVYDDQLAAVRKDSARMGTTGGDLDLSFLVDGLQSEREQGITIDVAYRYFATAARKFIIADCPGHEQYTRNMATGASNANLAVILIDARKGVLPQTRRHSFICSLLGIKHALIAVNKMDLVDHDAQAFARIEADYRAFAKDLGFIDLKVIPVSALAGDNVVRRSTRMPWYDGPTVLEVLERVELARDLRLTDLRFPVQYVNRPNADFRGFCGTLAAGAVKRGDRVMVLPSKRTSTVARILGVDGELESAEAPEVVTLTLADEVDVSRGDVIVHPDRAPNLGREFDADLVWMAEPALTPGKAYLFRLGTKYARGTVAAIHHEVDVNSQERRAAEALPMNHIGRVRVVLNEPTAFDAYAQSPLTGAFVVIDLISNGTLGAGMIGAEVARDVPDRAVDVTWHAHRVAKAQRAGQKQQRPCVVWFTGLSGSGKSTLANALEHELWRRGHHTYLLDGDNVRHGLNKDLDFSDAGRVENIRRIGEVARLFVDAGLIVITAFVSPFRRERELVRSMVAAGEFVEVFVDTPLAICEQRDPKGLYKKARAGTVAAFTGITSPYEAPEAPELRVETTQLTVEQELALVIAELQRRGVIQR